MNEAIIVLAIIGGVVVVAAVVAFFCGLGTVVDALKEREYLLSDRVF